MAIFQEMDMYDTNNHWRKYGPLELALHCARRCERGPGFAWDRGYAIGFASGLAYDRVIDAWEEMYVRNVTMARGRGISA